MKETIRAQIERLRAMNAAGVQARYRELFGREPTSTACDHVIRRIAWKIQALADGDLSEKAILRASEIAPRAELKGQVRFKIARVTTEAEGGRGQPIDPRLPAPGTMLSRVYRGRTIAVKVLTDGFECGGQKYSSLSAAARAVTGTRWNGLVFFGVAKRGQAAKVQKGQFGRAA